ITNKNKNMNRIKKWSVLLMIATFSVITGKGQDAKVISEKATEAIEYNSMEMVSTFKIYDARGSERVRQITTATKKFGEVNKTLIKFISPADVKGTAMLIYDYKNKDDDMWIYMPALRKIRRIVSTEKGKNFMGSEFTNADMSKPNMNDFEYKIIGTAALEGKTCWKIESVCNNDDIAADNGFSKKVSYIEKETYLCHKVEFYDYEGSLFKTQLIQDFRKQPNGKYFAYRMEMKNEQNGRKSVLLVDKFQIGSNLQEGSFTPAMLEK
ncbi:MAG: outer membrane lipoprotein-sorting protein, partial [Bacteroidales bacterium]|nr:outer membrane lipoprotein-sorting protein [Bacteroidales bacterium]